MEDLPNPEDVELAERLLAEWDEGRGTSKSRLELQTWNDATSHGRHFDRFVRDTLGVQTNRPSKQTDRIVELERQIRSLGAVPFGATTTLWEAQLQQARAACLAALRIWNDPAARFRTGAFSLLFVAAWNSLSIALIERHGGDWRSQDSDGNVRTLDGSERAREILDLVSEAFSGEARRGLRENVRFWVDLRNAVAHRQLPALDFAVIPMAQPGLLNFENVVFDEFGAEYTLAEELSVPLQLSGFRDPGILASRRRLQSSLPLDVQAVLSRADSAPPELLGDPSFIMRVAFVPVVPSSGRNPDAVAYFVKPGEVPTELADQLDRYVVLPKVRGGVRPGINPTDVVKEVERRTGFRLNTALHAHAARVLGARPPKDGPERTVNLSYAEFVQAHKRYLYTQAWIDRLVAELSTAEGFRRVTGKDPVPVDFQESEPSG